MSSRNIVTKEGDTIIKKYGNHLDFLNELRMYQRLKGTGLCPEMLYGGRDIIEHRYIDGNSLFDELKVAVGDEERLKSLFDMYINWYADFRRVTNQVLNHVDFRKFYMTSRGLCCIDFEHCKADFAESDLAKLCAQMYLVPRPFSKEAEDVCVLFIRRCKERFSLSSILFIEQLRSEVERIAKLIGTEFKGDQLEHFCKRIDTVIHES